MTRVPASHYSYLTPLHVSYHIRVFPAQLAVLDLLVGVSEGLAPRTPQVRAIKVSMTINKTVHAKDKSPINLVTRDSKCILMYLFLL